MTDPSTAASAGGALSHGDVAAINELRAAYQRLRGELARVIIGQNESIEQLLICILARGHGLLMGVPGLAKTTIVNCLSQVMSLEFNRIQFTPDLMPSDITGTDILQDTGEAGRRAFVFVKGPVFANIVLADEINRTPPKTQSALLEAMQERSVTVRGTLLSGSPSFNKTSISSPLCIFDSANFTYTDKDQRHFFDWIVELSTKLREARMAVYSVAPSSSVLGSGAHTLLYQAFLKGVKSPRQADTGNLGLKVIQPVVLSPFPRTALNAAFDGIKTVICVEENATAQLAMLAGMHGITIHKKILKYDGRPFTYESLLARVQEALS